MTAGWQGVGQERIDAGQYPGMQLRMDREMAEATRRREHYWMALVGFKVTPPVQVDALLDHESMRQPPIIGCFICEQSWSPGIDRRCPGEPS